MFYSSVSLPVNECACPTEVATRAGANPVPRLKDEIMAISRRTAALPRRTGRTADEVLGYDERGLPR